MFGKTAHTDTFARDNLPPPEQWPDLPVNRFDPLFASFIQAAMVQSRLGKGFG